MKTRPISITSLIQHRIHGRKIAMSSMNKMALRQGGAMLAGGAVGLAGGVAGGLDSTGTAISTGGGMIAGLVLNTIREHKSTNRGKKSQLQQLREKRISGQMSDQDRRNLEYLEMDAAKNSERKKKLLDEAKERVFIGLPLVPGASVGMTVGGIERALSGSPVGRKIASDGLMDPKKKKYLKNALIGAGLGGVIGGAAGGGVGAIEINSEFKKEDAERKMRFPLEMERAPEKGKGKVWERDKEQMKIRQEKEMAFMRDTAPDRVKWIMKDRGKKGAIAGASLGVVVGLLKAHFGDKAASDEAPESRKKPMNKYLKNAAIGAGIGGVTLGAAGATVPEIGIHYAKKKLSELEEVIPDDLVDKQKAHKVLDEKLKIGKAIDSLKGPVRVATTTGGAVLGAGTGAIVGLLKAHFSDKTASDDQDPMPNRRRDWDAYEEWTNRGNVLPGSGLTRKDYYSGKNIVEKIPWDIEGGVELALLSRGYKDLRSDGYGNIIARAPDGNFHTWDHETTSLVKGVGGPLTDRYFEHQMEPAFPLGIEVKSKAASDESQEPKKKPMNKYLKGALIGGGMWGGYLGVKGWKSAENLNELIQKRLDESRAALSEAQNRVIKIPKPEPGGNPDIGPMWDVNRQIADKNFDIKLHGDNVKSGEALAAGASKRKREGAMAGAAFGIVGGGLMGGLLAHFSNDENQNQNNKTASDITNMKTNHGPITTGLLNALSGRKVAQNQELPPELTAPIPRGRRHVLNAATGSARGRVLDLMGSLSTGSVKPTSGFLPSGVRLGLGAAEGLNPTEAKTRQYNNNISMRNKMIGNTPLWKGNELDTYIMDNQIKNYEAEEGVNSMGPKSPGAQARPKSRAAAPAPVPAGPKMASDANTGMAHADLLPSAEEANETAFARGAGHYLLGPTTYRRYGRAAAGLRGRGEKVPFSLENPITATVLSSLAGTALGAGGAVALADANGLSDSETSSAGALGAMAGGALGGITSAIVRAIRTKSARKKIENSKAKFDPRLAAGMMPSRASYATGAYDAGVLDAVNEGRGKNVLRKSGAADGAHRLTSTLARIPMVSTVGVPMELASSIQRKGDVRSEINADKGLREIFGI